MRIYQLQTPRIGSFSQDNAIRCSFGMTLSKQLFVRATARLFCALNRLG